MSANPEEILAKIAKTRIVPVVAIEDAADTESLCEALIAGHLPCAEITFRTLAAPEAIKAASKIPGMLVGAGTVLSVAQAQKAVDCGADFVVSPGFSPKVVEWCQRQGVLVLPGIATPTDLQMAVDFGLGVVKFFPAESYGGLKTLKALAAPYGMMRFMPTGGISPANVREYLSFKKIIACGGSWMVKSAFIAEKNFPEITRLAQEAVDLVKDV